MINPIARQGRQDNSLLKEILNTKSSMNEPTTYVLEYAARQIANVEGLPVLATFLGWDDLTTI